MAYVLLTNIEDEMLKTLVQQTDLDYADNYILYKAGQIGVKADAIPLNPVPPMVVELAIAVACARRAELKSGANPKAFQGSDGGDAYEQKRRVYQAKVDRLSASMLVQDFTGKLPDVINNFEAFSIQMNRS